MEEISSLSKTDFNKISILFVFPFRIAPFDTEVQTDNFTILYKVTPVPYYKVPFAQVGKWHFWGIRLSQYKTDIHPP